MSDCIKKLFTFLDNKLVNLDFQSYKLVNLSGTKESKDTILYLLERFLARDFGSYYDDIDSNLGVNYLDIKGTSTLQFTNGVSTYSDSKLSQRGMLPNIHCIRYARKDRVRSFLLDSEFNTEVIGTNMTRFTSVISNSKWSRLEKLANNLVGYDFVKIDVKNRKLSFDIHDFDSWTEEGIKFIYLLLSESMLTPDKYTRVTLLSEIELLSYEQVIKLIKTLSAVSRNEFIVFSNNISSDTLDFNYKVLNLSV